MYDADWKQLLRDVAKVCTPELFRRAEAEAEDRGEPYPRRFIYQRYINGPRWRSFRRLAIEAADDRCQRCGTPDYDDPDPLEVHHLHYDTIGNEAFTDVIVTCVPCHAALDPNRKKWLPRAIREAVGDGPVPL